MGYLDLKAEDMRDVVAAANAYDLDFDDAHQYVAADRYRMVPVTFDGDFARTPVQFRAPAEVTVTD